ncbi:MAG TPA: hypothetical protein VIN71_09865 [Pseudomonadales bacterium]
MLHTELAAPGWLARLDHPLAGRWLVLLGLLLVLPSLWAGLYADDVGHQLLLANPGLLPAPDKPGLYQLFSFIDNDPLRRQQQYAFGLLPWWTGSMEVNFFRPLSELSHALDARLGLPVWLMHAHNLLWYGVLLVLLALFYRQLLGEQRLAMLALLLFVVDATHGFTVAWIANRNALIAAVFLLLSVLALMRALRLGSPVFSCLSALAAVPCLLAGESGVALVAFVPAVFAWSRWQGRQPGISLLLPPLLVLLLWLLVYRYYGFGAHGSTGYYTDPLADPGHFLQVLPLRFFNGVAMQFNLLPLHLSGRGQLPLALLGVLIVLALLVFVRVSGWRPGAVLLALFLLCLLPVSAAVMQERNLLVAGIAGAPLLAAVLQWLWRQAASRRRAGQLAAVLVFFHLWLAVPQMLAMSVAPAVLARNNLLLAESVPQSWQQRQLLTIGVPLFDAVYMAPVALLYHQVLPQRLWPVTSVCRACRLAGQPTGSGIFAVSRACWPVITGCCVTCSENRLWPASAWHWMVRSW